MSGSMKQRIITGILLILICFPPLYIGGIPLRILVFTVSAIASYEIISIRKEKVEWGLVAFLFGSICIMYNVPDEFYVTAVSFFLIILFLINICSKIIDLNDVCYVFVVSLIITLAIKGIINIYNYGGLVMIFVAIACYGCDAGAYFFGYFFGKHKMIERISPKKTWEGAIGGYFTGAILSLIFGLMFVKTINVQLILIASATLPIVSQIGDLAFSAIKRHYDVKDYGSIFPGHGGVLDRLDSLLFCTMYFNALLLIYAESIVLAVMK